MPIHRRTITLAVVSLLLGVLTTIAVAWGIAAWGSHKNWCECIYVSLPLPSLKVQGGTDEFRFTESRTHGAVRRTWFRDVALTTTIGTGLDIGHPTPRRTGQPSDISPAWGLGSRVLRNPTAFGQIIGEHATGYPFLCVEYSIYWKPVPNLPFSSTIDTSSAVVVEFGDYDFFYDLRALPLRPIWYGILANTGIYAVFWLGLYKGLMFFVQLRRAHGGLCPHCRYSREGLTPETVCPECGKQPTLAEQPAAGSS